MNTNEPFFWLCLIACGVLSSAVTIASMILTAAVQCSRCKTLFKPDKKTRIAALMDGTKLPHLCLSCERADSIFRDRDWPEGPVRAHGRF